MKLLNIIHEDFVNYRKPSMTLEFPKCSMKCNHDAGKNVCHNSHLLACDGVDVPIEKIAHDYAANKFTKAVVCQGLDPIDSYDELVAFMFELRKRTLDDIVIYTGYREDELSVELMALGTIPNVIMKFGRFVPDDHPRFDDVLGVTLSSSNQYAKRIS